MFQIVLQKKNICLHLHLHNSFFLTTEINLSESNKLSEKIFEERVTMETNNKN